ncbi:ABC transporter G family member [Zostera marina]|uniref:ABC transporter G family member n=1 Tax=Zostera marina TaxID=29655 RepID=A0A0K9NIQ8_ZOSMR|nr:ABC transporter G family member [Zostera marina]
MEMESELELEKTNSFLKKPRRPITIKFEDVMYKIKARKGGNGNRQNILKKVSGIVKPGEMLALLGPSGSGKTTLITALGSRELSGRLSGSITYNNKPFNSSVKRNIGFVTQHDVHYPNLTVSETLRYTALLRLPDTLSRKEKMAMVDEVIESLGLVICRDSVVGGVHVRGVSGGERKRVSIGQELLVNPSLLFLDEPTSGLDSTTAQRIVSMLRDMARNGRTVLMTIHQPSTGIFYMFDKVMLLADGKQIYFGKGSDAMTYFKSIGYAPTMAMNPSDFMLDLANGVSSDESQSTASPDTIKNSLFSAFKTTNRPVLLMEMEEVGGGISDAMSIDGSKTYAQCDEGYGWCTSWWQQFVTLLHRDQKQRKHEIFSFLDILQKSFVTLLAGILWMGSKNNIADQSGLIIFIVSFWAFTQIGLAVLTFPLERDMLEKERSSSMYRLSSYFVAKTLGDIYLDLLLPTVCFTVVYWMAGLRPTAASYFETLSVILLTALVAQGFGLAIGSFVSDMKQATVTGNMLMLFKLLLSGYYLKSVPTLMQWLKYLSFLYHGYKLTMIAQFSMRTHLNPYEESLLEITRGGPIISVAVLLIMLVGSRLLAYLGLMKIGVPKK